MKETDNKKCKDCKCHSRKNPGGCGNKEFIIKNIPDYTMFYVSENTDICEFYKNKNERSKQNK